MGSKAPGGHAIAMRDEGRIDYIHTRLDDPRLCRQVGAGRQIADRSQLRQQQRARALRADQLARGIAPDAREKLVVRGDGARFHAAADPIYCGMYGAAGAIGMEG